MSGLATRFRTALALGPKSFARVGVYRLGLRAGLNPVKRLRATIPDGPFFIDSELAPIDAPASTRWSDTGLYFGWREASLVNGRPDWLRNPFQADKAARADTPWWTLPDFDPTIGDIKTIWEASRFDWAVTHAQRARNGVQPSTEILNLWIRDWIVANPPYLGPNWKCGQEASIRLMHLAAAALILNQTTQPLPALAALLEALLQRIEPTVGYAIGQNNNHGTSEAAALFIGGDWLAEAGDNRRAAKWHRRGRALLEERALHLIAPDGTFSQYSVAYHRLMLDTFSLAETWRRKRNLPPFSPPVLERLAAAARWLRELVDAKTGDAANLGANDGARLLPLTDTDYRDFRPSVQLSSALFEDRRAYDGDGAWNAPLAWLGIAAPANPAERPSSRRLDDGGLALLRDDRTLAVLRYPRFRFRPSHADALHVDLWRDGENLLRDSGSYSYADAAWNGYFSGTRSHNTIEFDDRDQMPRLGRFLFGDWLKAGIVAPPSSVNGIQKVAAGYRDGAGARHNRDVTLSASGLTVIDEISGFELKAILRWRLAPGSWRLTENGAESGQEAITVGATMPIMRLEIVTGYESRHYLSMTELPVLEVEVATPGTLTSHYRFPS